MARFKRLAEAARLFGARIPWQPTYLRRAFGFASTSEFDPFLLLDDAEVSLTLLVLKTKQTIWANQVGEDSAWEAGRDGQRQTLMALLSRRDVRQFDGCRTSGNCASVDGGDDNRQCRPRMLSKDFVRGLRLAACARPVDVRM
jgi:hypothetical protein